jgi:hypothetical protein
MGCPHYETPNSENTGKVFLGLNNIHRFDGKNKSKREEKQLPETLKTFSDCSAGCMAFSDFRWIEGAARTGKTSPCPGNPPDFCGRTHVSG